MNTLKEKNVAFYTQETIVTDVVTGEILSSTSKTVTKTSSEPEYIKIYYETMLAFNQVHGIPVSFVLAMSKFIEFTNEGDPMYITLNKRCKTEIAKACDISLVQVDRYVKKAANSALLFRTQYRGVYELNPFMIAKGKWDSIQRLRSNFDFVDGKWTRTIDYKHDENDDEELRKEA